MREKESGRLERETEGSRRGRSRASSSKRYGYIHRVDQSSISFFVTNFPDDSTVEDLWMVFARHGRVGDVYIPNKVDKWGRRFAFVKYRDVKEVGELNQSLEEVWLGTFKLRVNKYRFERNEDLKKKEDSPRPKSRAVGEGEGRVQQGCSFRTALVRNEGRDYGFQDHDVLNVEVDDALVKELEQSFVGKLVLNVEVGRIKTTLYMEGLAHISVTDMGGKMVLLHSPKAGEMEVMCSSKPDWLTYYFKEVRPWSPSSFMDRRIAWVKVYGIPLHVWGENLFKAIGRKYGEFLDFDENTASRAKLDVARIKISTNFRGCIDDPLKVKVVGSVYNLRIVEERGMEEVFNHGDRMEENVFRWGESSKFPGEAMEVHSGAVGGSEEAEVVGESFDFLLSQKQVHGEEGLDDGDVSLYEEGKSTTQLLVSARQEGVTRGIGFQKECLDEISTEFNVGEGGAQRIMLTESELGDGKLVGSKEGGNRLMEICQVEGAAKISDRAVEVQDSPFENLWSHVGEPNRGRTHARSMSLPPIRAGGVLVGLGQRKEDGLDFSDTISLIEVRRGVYNNSVSDEVSQTQEKVPKQRSQRGRSRKSGNCSKMQILRAPKFVQFAEVVKVGGGKRRRKEKGVSRSREQNRVIEEQITTVQDSLDGPILEVVLLDSETSTAPSGVDRTLDDDQEDETAEGIQISRESAKLLEIQKK
ncbi:RNA recognition motif, partial [Trifolium medium]|nr:RNA recognition motif [Trifolium medium]